MGPFDPARAGVHRVAYAGCSAWRPADAVPGPIPEPRPPSRSRPSLLTGSPRPLNPTGWLDARIRRAGDGHVRLSWLALLDLALRPCRYDSAVHQRLHATDRRLRRAGTSVFDVQPALATYGMHRRAGLRASASAPRADDREHRGPRDAARTGLGARAVPRRHAHRRGRSPGFAYAPARSRRAMGRRVRRRTPTSAGPLAPPRAPGRLVAAHRRAPPRWVARSQRSPRPRPTGSSTTRCPRTACCRCCRVDPRRLAVRLARRRTRLPRHRRAPPRPPPLTPALTCGHGVG